ncbi:MAG: hypothetical protein ABR910_18280 [Acidobacteriaceae bacterium]|jgi:hypothetical protein
MVSASQIRDLIRSYLSGSLNLRRFAEAFEDIYSAINVASEPQVLALGDHVQTLLSRVSAKIATENDLRGWLQSLSQTFNPGGASVQYDGLNPATYSQDEGYLITA